MKQTILELLVGASVAIGYFISLALIITPFYKSKANNYLSITLFLFANITLLDYANQPGLAFVIIANLRLDILFAATLFIFFLTHIQHPMLNGGRYKWLYAPFISCVLLEVYIFTLNLYPTEFEIIALYVRDNASIVFNVLLIFWGRKLVQNAKTISEDKRHWLLRLNLFILITIMSWVLSRIEFYLFDSQNTRIILQVFLSLFFWWILYYGIFRLQVIVQKEAIHDYLVSNRTKAPQVKKKLDSTATSRIISQLFTIMEEEELYKNPLLSRLELANHLGTNEGYLSQIINQEINKSVIQFVNEYRVEAAKKLLQDPVFNKYSVEAIGMEAGFKSKSAFYNVFKSNLGMSPGAYRKLQKTY